MDTGADEDQLINLGNPLHLLLIIIIMGLSHICFT